jgi:hypothetical protein
MEMKTSKTIRACGITIPAGTTLNFSNEDYCVVRGKRIPKAIIIACEANGSELAEKIMTELSQKYADGFSETQLVNDYGKLIDGCTYALMHVDDEAVLMLKSPQDEAIELYLTDLGNDKFKFDGEYHVASDSKMSFSVEAMPEVLTNLISNIQLAIESVSDKTLLKSVLYAANTSLYDDKVDIASKVKAMLAKPNK